MAGPPEPICGLDRFVASKTDRGGHGTLGLLDGVDPHVLAVPMDEKSKTVVIEPYLTDQWYVDAKVLAQPALAAVRDGKTVFEPKHWDKTYFQWLENIEPWCISRQLWWGHRIPAWYGPGQTLHGDGHTKSLWKRMKALPRANIAGLHASYTLADQRGRLRLSGFWIRNWRTLRI